MTVRVEINAHNIELTDRLRDYVTKKAVKLDRYLDTIDQVQVDLDHRRSARSAGDRQVAQVTARGKGVLLRAENRSEDIYVAFDQTLDKIERQAERYKGKHWHNRGDGRSAAQVGLDAPTTEPDTGDLGPAIVRRKRFALTPMDENEAIEQMALLSHEDFFVFLNATTGLVNVLYRRRDGALGLIEPEID
ncbi:MAG TPA: ribosome-associated translation inhibitor RaiA [Anaerolineales bacterium]|nr:ribosome-associated translation inhibitor RaiA [Anaerolineales bacterium]